MEDGVVEEEVEAVAIDGWQLEFVITAAFEYSATNECDVVVLYSTGRSFINKVVTPPLSYAELHVWNGHAIYILEER